MMSYFLANKVLDGMIGRTSIFSSATYLGLSTTAPTRDGKGYTEPPAENGYKRTALGISGQLSSQKMRDGISGGTQNKETIYFPEATGSWGECTYYLLFDKAEEGNLLAYGELDEPITPVNGTVPLIRIGELQMTIS